MTSKIVVNNIEADAGISTVTFASEVTAPTFNGNITGTAATFTTGTFSGNVDIAGALTYEDVTNVDAVGLSTFRNGIHVTGGSVGIGTDNPTETLTLNHASGASIGLEYSGTENGTINVNSAAMYVRAGTGKHLILGSDGTEKLRITSTGSVGIGTDNPLRKLDILGTGRPVEIGSTNATNIVKLYNSATGRSTYNGVDIQSNSTAGGIISAYGGYLDLRTSSSNGSDATSRLRITSAGNLGIGGLTNPGALLSIPAGESNTPRLAIESAVDDNDFTITQYEDGNGTYTMLGQNVKLNSGGNNTILDSGHRTAGILLDARNHGSIVFLTGGANAVGENLKIDDDGRVLVGPGAIATPKCGHAGIDIPNNDWSIIMGGSDGNGNRANNANKDGRFAGAHYVNAEEPVGIIRCTSGASDNILYMGGGTSLVNAATQISLYTAANTTTTGGTERVRIDSSGQVSINKFSAVSAKLHIGDTSNDGALSQLVKLGNDSSGSGTGAQLNLGAGNANESTAACIGGFYDGTGTSFIIKTAGTYVNQSTVAERVRVDGGGRMLLGQQKTFGGGTYYDDITINNSNNASGAAGGAGIDLISGNDSWGGYIFSDSDAHARGYLKYDHGDDELVFGTASQNRAFIKSSGSVRLTPEGSTSNPNAEIDTSGDNVRILTMKDGSGGCGLVFSTQSGGALGERMKLHDDGRLVVAQAQNVNNFNSNNAAVHINSHPDGGRGGLFIYNSGVGGGTADVHYGIKIDAHGCANNATLQSGILIDVNQQYVQSGTGVDSDVAGSYNTQTCYKATLRKNLGAYTSGYSYLSNIITSSAGGNAYHMRCEDNGTLKLLILQNGNIQNTNNSYGAFSDIKLKENIVDAGSQWEDIKAVRVRNFNLIADPDNTKMIGVVAQEIETVSAGLVKTENDIEVDGATGEGNIVGTTKSVKYSILYMKAIKALQEAMGRIETLEAQNTALTARVTALEGS